MRKAPGGECSLYIYAKVWARGQERAESLGGLGKNGNVPNAKQYLSWQRLGGCGAAELLVAASTFWRRYLERPGGGNDAKTAKAWHSGHCPSWRVCDWPCSPLGLPQAGHRCVKRFIGRNVT